MSFVARTLALFVILSSGGLALAQVGFAPTDPPTEEREPARLTQAKFPAPTQQQLAELSKGLNSDDFKTRENTQIALAKLATDHPEATIDPILENYIDSSTVPEARYRLRAILYNSRKSVFMDNPPGFVGIVMLPVGQFVQVSTVVAGSAAARDGLVERDLIVSIDGKTFSRETDPSLEFSSYVMSKKAGDRVTLKVMRQNIEKEIKITLGKRPEELMDSRFQARFDAQFKLWLDQQIERLKARK